MSDSNSTAIYADMFNELALSLDAAGDQHRVLTKSLAFTLWRQSWQYDFNPFDMEVDDALVALGLAKPHRNDDCPEYMPKDGWGSDASPSVRFGH